MRYSIAMLVRAFLSCLMLLIACPALAGAWLQPAGNGIAITQTTYFTSDEFFDTDSARQPQNKFTKYEWQPYVEYGLSERWTVGGTAYLNYVEQNSDDNYGLADAELFARTRLWRDDTSVLSLQPLIKSRSFYQDNSTPRGGSKSYDAELSLLYGQQFTLLSARDYVDLRLGYRWRSHSRKPQWRADAAVAIHLSDAWQLIGAVRAIYSETTSRAFSENGDQDFKLLKTELTAQYAFNDRHWLQASMFTHVDGTMVGAGNGFSLGFGRRF